MVEPAGSQVWENHAAVSAVRLATRLLRAPSAGVAVRRDGVFRFISSHGVSQQFLDVFESDGTTGILGAVTQSREPVRARDVRQVQGVPPAVIDEGVRAVLCVPLLADGEVEGCFFVARDEPRAFTDEDEVILIMLADEMMTGLSDAAQLDDERRSRVRAEVMLEVANAAASGESPRRVLARVAAIATGFSVAERCTIFLYDPETTRLAPFVSSLEGGARDDEMFARFRDMPPPRFPEVRGFVEAVARLQPLYEPDAQTSDLLPAEWTHAFGSLSAMIYPLAVKDRLVGMMILDTFTFATEFPGDEVAVMSAVAGDAALAVERMRLLARLNKQAQTDALTGLINRHTAQMRLEQLFSETADAGRQFSLLLIDIDKMSAINHRHGNNAGDLAISRVADVLRAVLPPEGFAARWGGDEFLVVLPAMSPAAARGLGRRILHEASRRSLHLGPKREIVPLYLSIGHADGQSCTDSGDMLRCASEALGRAKLAGGNAVLGRDDRTAEGLRTVAGLLDALAAKSPGAADEARQVAYHAGLIARKVGMSAEACEELRLGALLRDVGHLSVPDTILLKSGPLTADEREQIRQHVAATGQILRGSSELAAAVEAAAAHHERWDGGGYPLGLKGDDIPLEGRILAVADAYVAMRSARPHRGPMSHSQALNELRACEGTQFDPELVAAFIAVLDTEASRVA